MMNHNQSIRLVLIATLLGWGSMAGAQSASDLTDAVTTGSQFEQAQEYSRQQQQQQEYASVLAGEPGVFILAKNDIYQFSAAFGTGYTDNPARALDSTDQASLYATAALSAGINTKLAQRFDSGVNLIVSGTQYGDSDAPSYRNMVSNAYVGTPIFGGRFYASANASAGLNMTDDFGHGLAFYVVGGNVSTVWRLGQKWFLRPYVNVARQWSGRSEQDNFAVGGGAELIWKPGPKWAVRTNAAFTHREYDNFYEDVTFVVRKDEVVRAGIGVSRQLGRRADLSLNFDYTDQDSSFFLSSYKAFDGGLSLKLTRRF